MVKCPKCQTEVCTPVKTWSIPSRQPLKEGRTNLLVGIFECQTCKARFRAGIDTATKPEETISIKNMVERIKGIQGELMQTLRNLRERIKDLETQRADLLTEINSLRKAAELRVNALETEVDGLREDVKSLRQALGYTEGIEADE